MAMWYLPAGIMTALATGLWLQTARLSNTQDDLATMRDRFGTCKADYGKILEDVKDDAHVDNTPLDELLNPEWLFDGTAGGGG